MPPINLCQLPAEGKGFGAQAPPPPTPASLPSLNGSQPRHTYTSFLCFSLVLASEILLLRFLSRIFCSSFFSLEQPGGTEGFRGRTPGTRVPLHSHRTLYLSLPFIQLLQSLELGCVCIQDNLPEPLLTLGTQAASQQVTEG